MMARLPALIDAFVQIDGRDRAMIEHVARVIREEGFIPTTKRGSGASVMTATAAVNLLFALNGASSPKEGPAAVERLRQLIHKSPASHSEVFNDLAEKRGFGEAVECLIDTFPSISAFYGKDVRQADEYFFDAFTIKIEIHRGRASIQMQDGASGYIDFNRSYHFRRGSEHALSDTFDFDRRVVVHLSAKTIFALWRCVTGA